jgi:hypothetical protein
MAQSRCDADLTAIHGTPEFENEHKLPSCAEKMKWWFAGICSDGSLILCANALDRPRAPLVTRRRTVFSRSRARRLIVADARRTMFLTRHLDVAPCSSTGAIMRLLSTQGPSLWNSLPFLSSQQMRYSSASYSATDTIHVATFRAVGRAADGGDRSTPGRRRAL